MPPVRTTLVGLLIIIALGGPTAAQNGGPAPRPADDPTPPAGPAPPVPVAPAPETARDAHLRALRAAIVHFEFRRAPLADIAAALERATNVPVHIGDAARRALERRKFKMRYVADRTGVQVLEDLAKAAALDAEVTNEGAVLDTPAVVRRLREKLGIPAKPVRLGAADVARMLQTKRLSFTARDKPLDAVLDFLRDETGLRFVIVAADVEPKDGAAPEGDDPPKVTVQVTDEPLQAVLDLLLTPVGWAWARQGTVVIVGRAEVIAEQTAPDPEADDAR